MKIAIVGVTGMVGSVMLKVLEERNFPITELIPVASERSLGKIIHYKGNDYEVVLPETAIGMRPDIAIFSAGGGTSLKYAPGFAAVGCFVIDNSSAWRMDPDKKLIVPEINSHELGPDDKIIANPNCSTIQMVMSLAPLHKKFGIIRLVISTYQSITGTGVSAVKQYNAEREGLKVEDPAYPHQIYENCLPHCDVFLDNGYTKEEMKLVHETRKILGDNEIKITATAVRVPVNGGHSESINVQFEKETNVEEIKSILSDTSGIIVEDKPKENTYPMPLTAKDSDAVFVGRIRKDESLDNAFNLWVVSDNLRKGAATNAVQIAEYLLKEKHIESVQELVK
jgi:aspartate-semialdehyde dehydrogenase